jgi:hypothetical protein
MSKRARCIDPVSIAHCAKGRGLRGRIRSAVSRKVAVLGAAALSGEQRLASACPALFPDETQWRPMTTLFRIDDRNLLINVLDGEGVFLRPAAVLDGLTAEEAHAKPHSLPHSIVAWLWHPACGSAQQPSSGPDHHDAPVDGSMATARRDNHMVRAQESCAGYYSNTGRLILCRQAASEVSGKTLRR